METQAVARNQRISPRKCRLTADQVRNLSVGEALDILRFSREKAAQLVRKTLESALANAENNHGADIDLLHVCRITVDEGPVFKRFRPRARGRVGKILKRTSHITVVLSDAQE